MNEKIEITFYIAVSGYPDVSSNLLYEDIDMLQILLTELSSTTIIDKFVRLVSEHHKITHWLQGIEVFPVEKNQNEFVLLTVPLFEDENGIPKILISVSKLKKIIKDWEYFTKEKKKFTKIY